MSTLDIGPEVDRFPGRETRDADFTVFMARALPTLTRVAWRLAGDEHRAADLVQQALVRTYVAWPRVREPLAYARRAVVTQWINSTRNHRHEQLVAPQEIPEGIQADTYEAVADRDQLARALARLGARQRRVVLLRHVKGFSEKEVAEMLGISVGTVKSTSSRGLERLRTTLREETWVDDSTTGRLETVDVDTGAVLRRGRRRRMVQLVTTSVVAVALVVGCAVLVMARPRMVEPADDPHPTSTTWTSSPADQATIPVLKGMTTAQIVERAAARTGIPVADFEAALADPASIGLPAEADGNVEGWLFPADYEVAPDATAAQVLATMVGRTEQALTDKGVPKDQWETVLIKASIVEQEAGRDEDRPLIARAVDNRLARGMLLEVDSTVSYGAGLTGDEWAVARSDASNPYNTYVHVGLPPGPIASPGMASVDAVLNPAAGDWAYWCTVNPETGEMKFAVDLEEHQANVDELREWTAQHGSTEEP